MKYFSPSYWFQMWLLSAPLFNYKNEPLILDKSLDTPFNLSLKGVFLI